MTEKPEFSVWFTPTPKTCDNCGGSFGMGAGTLMFDAATKHGPWGCFCNDCYLRLRKYEDLGIGKGQKYRRLDDGKFWLVDGAPGPSEE